VTRGICSDDPLGRFGSTVAPRPVATPRCLCVVTILKEKPSETSRWPVMLVSYLSLRCAAAAPRPRNTTTASVVPGHKLASMPYSAASLLMAAALSLKMSKSLAGHLDSRGPAESSTHAKMRAARSMFNGSPKAKSEEAESGRLMTAPTLARTGTSSYTMSAIGPLDLTPLNVATTSEDPTTPSQQFLCQSAAAAAHLGTPSTAKRAGAFSV
jgi:hypothetical protein